MEETTSQVWGICWFQIDVPLAEEDLGGWSIGK